MEHGCEVTFGSMSTYTITEDACVLQIYIQPVLRQLLLPCGDSMYRLDVRRLHAVRAVGLLTAIHEGRRSRSSVVAIQRGWIATIQKFIVEYCNSRQMAVETLGAVAWCVPATGSSRLRPCYW